MYWKIILIISVFLSFAIFSQTAPIVHYIDDEKQVEGVIYSIVQGIRQHKVAYLTSCLDSSNLNLESINKDFKTFFVNSEKRKNNLKWINLSPKLTLPANWDFEITKPEIVVYENQAIAKLNFYWLIDVPIFDKESKNELKEPTKKISDIWHLKKINDQWLISKTDVFISVLLNNLKDPKNNKE